MDDAKRAIMCALASPHIRTVLIRGGPGSAKTVLARSAGNLTDREVVNLPLNSTDDRIFGGLDSERAILEGRAVLQEGVLGRADGNILYIDDANLMESRQLASILDCVESGYVPVERDGVSAGYPVDTVLIASMNPSDSDIAPHLLDRFDLCAYSSDDDRMGVLERISGFCSDPDGFSEEYADQEEGIRSRIALASRLIPMVTMSDDLMRLCSELSYKVGAEGFRGDVAMARASVALAALDGRDEVLRKDVEDAAKICLVHRRDYPPEPENPNSNERNEDDVPDDDRDPPDDNGESDQPSDLPPLDADAISKMLEDMVFEIGEEFRTIDYMNAGRKPISRTSSRAGRRQMAESSDSTGRYARSRIPDGRISDLALDATIRAAAPYQRTREHGNLAISIEPRDIRTKVRERRSGCTVLFLVDASGSLGAMRRMSAVKGAVLSMLKDSYVSRDRVGLMAFRRDRAELILPPTRSVEYGYRKLEELPTGGRTPLAGAIASAAELMTSYSRCHPGERCCVVVITDGRGNVPLEGGTDGTLDAVGIAETVSVPGLEWIVVDAGTGFVRFDDAEKLAEALGGRYFRLEDLDADRLAMNVRISIRDSRIRRTSVVLERHRHRGISSIRC